MFSEKLFQTKLLSRLSHKVCCLLSSPVLLRKFTNKFMQRRRRRQPEQQKSNRFKVMLHETIRNDDFLRNTALQHCCDIVLNGYNIVPT